MVTCTGHIGIHEGADGWGEHSFAEVDGILALVLIEFWKSENRQECELRLRFATGRRFSSNRLNVYVFVIGDMVEMSPRG